jgi:hypothetical protein
MLSTLSSLIKTVIDKHAPIKIIKISKPPAPWLKNDIKMLIKQKNRLHKKIKSNHLIHDKFKNINKLIKSSIKEAKQSYIEDCLTHSNKKGVWNVVNKLLRPYDNPIKHNLNQINLHFVNTAQRVLGKTPQNQDLDLSNNTGSFKFQKVQNETIEHLLSHIKTDTATGSDQIPPKFIKPFASLISPHLTNIINQCITNSYFPQNWKTCKVCPVPKIHNPSELDHYRPISILPCLSKIFEKVIASQIIAHMESSSYFPDTMSGCRKGHSTTTALLHIRDTCYRAMKSNEITILSLTDFSKAFDTVNHSKLLQILTHYNFSNSSIAFLQSYLTNRSQYSEHNNISSQCIPTTSGVPQGSILGPILFNIYTLSISESITNNPSFTSVNYVDDFQFSTSGPISQLPLLKSKTSQALQDIQSSSTHLDLAFNQNKSNFLIIASNKHHNHIDLKNTNKIDSINRCLQQKNLGVLFDQSLNFYQHHTYTLKSCYGIIHSIKHLKHQLSKNNKSILINSLIFSKLYYACLVTHPLNNHWTSQYNRLFKTTMSFIHNRFIHSHEMFHLGFLTPHNTWLYYLVTTAFKALYHTEFPRFLQLQLHHSTAYNLRSNYHPSIQINSKIHHNTFQYLAAFHFNNLPSHLRDITDFDPFKRAVKTHLLNSQLQL